ncbi:NDMA-dependent alcohol dehydrogenase [Actinomycetospora sp. TBRC 11914]|uniref:NDMA-dependent alcohol dehydrogenase n=1 Tax=Actinomycetospora sp. TBRC 11914 TaxID=2729387 RepID=UPI00145D8F09|nr:NDMA-dependent alcohol dehydrogenase [Actinomycetospora sp. TBRC 11914]NMO88251.1 NDMA-dependent alcohol dehydrogenase [Actinomycetospora sp. TBRC 11914]
MRTRGAVVREAPGKYEVVDIDLDDPRPGELQVRVMAAGLCHSDDHIATRDLPVAVYPFAGGHEGAGIVTVAPPNHKGIREGDHVVFSFVPACGRCRWCAVGRSHLCNMGGSTLSGARPGTTDDFRLHLAEDGRPVGQMSGLSTFCATTTVSVDSVVPLPDDIDFEVACLLSCGVGTGWGSAVNDAAVRPGDAVIVMGVGGVGINAVQGAAHAGATTLVGVDPVPFKREKALEFGATHAVATMDEAVEIVRGPTDGQGADSAIVTVGVTRPDHIGEAFAAIRKAGTCVVTGVGLMTQVGIDIPAGQLAFYGKRLQGSLFGSTNAGADIARQIQLYRQGALKLDELVTTTYALDDIAQGYEDMHAGRNLRGVVVHEH